MNIIKYILIGVFYPFLPSKYTDQEHLETAIGGIIFGAICFGPLLILSLRS
jgi:hypothetical protein